MRGRTLEEKRYGPGFRPGPVVRTAAPWPGCSVEGCPDPVHGTAELYVDDPPPTLDWYTRVLAKLPARTWTRLGFCESHLRAVVERSEDYQTQPDLWAPGRDNPPVLPRPVKLLRPS